MNNWLRRVRCMTLGLLGLMLATGNVLAGQPCEPRELTVEQMANGINLAAQTVSAKISHHIFDIIAGNIELI